MYSFTVRVANCNIEIETLHVRTSAICRDYIVTETPDLNIKISQEDIDYDRADYEAAIGYCEKWDGYLEMFTVLRKMADALIDYGSFLLHGAAISVNDEALVFVANSGTGKTTHIRKWLENYPNTFVINGDKPFIQVGGKRPLVCGTPWAGKENLNRNVTIPLKAIIFMERSEENSINPISFSEAILLLYQHIYRPENPSKMRSTLELLKSLKGKVSFWCFRCNNFKDNCLDVASSIL